MAVTRTADRVSFTPANKSLDASGGSKDEGMKDE